MHPSASQPGCLLVEIADRLDVGITRGLTPLVGREQETGLLVERWEQVKDGQGQVVLLSGEAGIGKSRLVQVLKDHVAGEAHMLLECRSSPYYENTALYPITDLLQRTLQWQQEGAPEQRLENLERYLRQYRLPMEESVQLFAPLLSLSIPEDRYPPLTWTPQRQRQETLESIVAMLLEHPEIKETQPELVAHHYTEAALHQQAVDYWQWAGQRALQRSAYAEANNHLSKGFEVLERLPDTSERLQHELALQTTLGPATLV